MSCPDGCGADVEAHCWNQSEWEPADPIPCECGHSEGHHFGARDSCDYEDLPADSQGYEYCPCRRFVPAEKEER